MPWHPWLFLKGVRAWAVLGTQLSVRNFIHFWLLCSCMTEFSSLRFCFALKSCCPVYLYASVQIIWCIRRQNLTTILDRSSTSHQNILTDNFVCASAVAFVISMMCVHQLVQLSGSRGTSIIRSLRTPALSASGRAECCWEHRLDVSGDSPILQLEKCAHSCQSLAQGHEK